MADDGFQHFRTHGPNSSPDDITEGVIFSDPHPSYFFPRDDIPLVPIPPPPPPRLFPPPPSEPYPFPPPPPPTPPEIVPVESLVGKGLGVETIGYGKIGV